MLYSLCPSFICGSSVTSFSKIFTSAQWCFYEIHPTLWQKKHSPFSVSFLHCSCWRGVRLVTCCCMLPISMELGSFVTCGSGCRAHVGIAHSPNRTVNFQGDFCGLLKRISVRFQNLELDSRFQAIQESFHLFTLVHIRYCQNDFAKFKQVSRH